jgi:arylformamidase
MTDAWRAQFDAEVSFSNGGWLRVEAFRLDIPGQDISDGELAALFVRHLGLLMVGEVRIQNKQLLREPHKGSRGVVDPGPRGGSGRILELSHEIRHRMVT